MERKTLYLLLGGIGLLLVGGILLFLIFGHRAPAIITIHFDVNGGVPLDSIDLTKGTSTLLPTPYKEGFVFQGWYIDNQKVDDLTKFTEDQILEAKWVAEDDLPVQIAMPKKQNMVIQAKKAINTATQKVQSVKLTGETPQECYTFKDLGIAHNSVEGKVTITNGETYRVTIWDQVFGINDKSMEELTTDDTTFTITKPEVECK